MDRMNSKQTCRKARFAIVFCSLISLSEALALYPEIENPLPASNVTATSADVSGNLVSTGTTWAAVFAYWGTSDGATNASAWANTNIWPEPQLVGIKTLQVTGLLSSTTYFFRFAASNSGQQVWASNSVSFTTAMLDTDSDGLSDSWEQTYFGGPTNADPLLDTDGDGMNNGNEFVAGTNPTNALSVFKILELVPSPPGSATNRISWLSVTGITYYVEGAQSLVGGSFSCFTTGIVATPPTNTVYLCTTQRFHRIRAVSQAGLFGGGSTNCYSVNVAGSVDVSVGPSNGLFLAGMNLKSFDGTLMALIGSNRLQSAYFYGGADQVILWNPLTAKYQAYAIRDTDNLLHACGNLSQWLGPPTNPVVSHGMAFWIKRPGTASESRTVSITGEAPSVATKQMNAYAPHWFMMSYPFAADIELVNTGMTLGNDGDSVLVYDPVIKAFREYTLWSNSWYDDALNPADTSVLQLGAGLLFLPTGSNYWDEAKPYAYP